MTPAPRLSDVVDGVRRHVARRAWWAALPWAATSLAGVLVAAWLFVGSGEWAQGSAVPLVLDAALVAALAVGIVLVRRLLRRRLADPSLTGSIEAAAGLPEGAVLGPLELSRGVPPGVSGPLAARAEQGVVERLDGGSGRLAGRLGDEAGRWSRRGWSVLAALVPVVIILAAAAPARTIAAWKGLGNPVGLLARPVLPALTVEPGDVEVPRGADVRIVVTAPLRDSVTVRWQASGDVARSAVSPISNDRARFVLRDVRGPVRYRVVAPDGARSPDFTITPVDPLFVADVTVELAFPPHTGRSPEEYRGDVPPLTMPAGTSLSIRGSASRDLSAGALLDSLEREVASFSLAGPSFEGRWRPATGGTYRWRFAGAEGEDAEITPLPLVLTVVPDSAPEVRFSAPGRDTVLPASMRQPLEIRARDDHGVRTLELVAWRVTATGEREEPRVQALDLGSTRAVLVRPLLDLSDWGLLPGDTVRYLARVRDNAPEARTATTPEYVLRMPGPAEMRRDVERQLDEASERLEDLADRAERSEAATRDLERRTAAAAERQGRESLRGRPEPGREQVGFQEREDVRRALEDQAGMEAEVDSLRSQLEEMAEAMRDAGLSEPGLREDLDELQELLEETASPEQAERLEAMKEALQTLDPEEARQALEQLLAEQEVFREQLERSIERFKRAAVEQDFRSTTAEAEELARQEEALADAFREGDDPAQRAEQQEALEERAQEMEEGMERLEERLQELGETDAAAEVREARERSGESRRQMARAGQQARQGQGEQAGESADQASQELDQAAQELQEAQRQMASEQAAAMERALRQAADEALSLARRQADVGEEMRGASEERMASLRGDVAAVEQGVRNMAESLQVTTGGQAGGRELSEGMGRAMEALRRTVESMERSAGPSRSPRAHAEEAVDALNQVALMAMAGARQMSQNAQQQQSQGQSAGEGDVQQQLESLAQQQGQLNNQAGQLMPMQLGQAAMRSQLERMSRDQESVAEELGELADRPGARDETLGDLDALAEEARALARELAGGRLEPETRRRQERLFHRLLDAGRSLEKEELGEERESARPGAFERGEILPLDAEALGVLRFRLPDAAVLQRLSPAERRLVVEYFERLNRDGGEGAGGTGGGRPPDGGSP